MAWHTPKVDINAGEVGRLQKQQDHLCATACSLFRQFGRRVVVACHRDDAAFFAQLSTQASELTSPHQAREFWKVIRRSLPKMKARRLHPSPMQLEHLEEQWHPYFQQLEVGIATSPEELVRECFDFQSAQQCDVMVCQLGEMPSRAQIANAFRATHRAKPLD